MIPWRLILIALLVASPLRAQTPVENPHADDEAELTAQRLPIKGPELLTILRSRIPSAEIQQQFAKHVAGLHASSYVERMKATSELKKMGPVVRPLLEHLIQEIKADAETMGRLRLVLEQFPPEKDHAAVIAATRLLQRDKPAGSLAVLFDFVPYATDEMVRQEVQRAIEAVALIDNLPAPLLTEALRAAHPAKRAAAAEALLRVAKRPIKGEMESLLKDPDPLVRYQVGLALVDRHDKAGVPLLIQTLTDPVPERVEKSLDLLYRAAGADAPSEAYQSKAQAAEFRRAWEKWYEKNHAKLDLAKSMAKNDHAFTIITCQGIGAKMKNTVFELAPDHQTVGWSFEGIRYPVDVQILGSNRLLIAEYLDRRVTERDFKGNILWQVPANLPTACQRLPNGQTFIATRQQILIVDRSGAAVFTWQPQAGTISAAQRLRNGQFVVVSGNRCQLVSAKGDVLKSFMIGVITALGGNIEVLPNGRILAPLLGNNCIVEYDWDGNKLWQASVNRPMSVTRLKSGNTLVTSNTDSRVLEIDKNGVEVWSYRTENRPFRARPR